MYEVSDTLQMIKKYFSNPVWMGLFEASLIYWFIIASKSKKKALLAVFLTFFLFVNNHVMRIVEERFDEKAVFYRHLWAIPYITVIWLMFLDMFKRWHHIAFRVLVVVAGCSVFFFVAPNPPLKTYLMQPTNPRLLSDDVLRLSDELDRLQKEQGKQLVVLCPEELCEALPLYNGSVYFFSDIMVRKMSQSGYEVLHSSDPDVAYIMSKCCENGIDYAIIPREEGERERFQADGYEPVCESNSYDIYECRGYQGYKVEYTGTWGQTNWLAYIDADGNYRDNEQGYCFVRNRYNRAGLLCATIYCDKANKPVMIGGRYETHYSYNKKRQLVLEEYFDENGQPMDRVDTGYASMRVFHKDLEHIISEAYYNAEGKPVMNKTGYASCEKRFDKDGREIGLHFFDLDGNPTITYYGCAGYTYEYDKNGNMVKTAYWDTEGNAAMFRNGYAEMRLEYNENNQLIKLTYWDTDKTPCLSVDGYHGYIRCYDEQGRLASIVYIDNNDSEMLLGAGYSRIEYRYDDDGQLAEESYYAFEESIDLRAS